jgi:hypothetical protein
MSENEAGRPSGMAGRRLSFSGLLQALESIVFRARGCRSDLEPGPNFSSIAFGPHWFAVPRSTRLKNDVDVVAAVESATITLSQREYPNNCAVLG